MNIYLIRHGDAEKASAQKRDFDRELTPEGESKIRNAAEAWKLVVPSFSHLITSPLIRSIQTAEVVANTYKFSGKIILDKRLAPGSRTEVIIDLTHEIMGNDMAFVGHEPDFSEHVSNLISSNGARVDFKKGMIAKISFEGKVRLGRGVLEFLIPTKVYK